MTAILALLGLLLLWLAYEAIMRRRYPHKECPACGGSGKSRWPGRKERYRPCSTCKGSGKVK